LSFWIGKKVAVTGGAGMIGAYLSRMLFEAGAEVTVIDNYDRPSPSRLREAVAEGIRVHYADATDTRECARAFAGKDAVFNLAAKVTGMHYNRRHHSEMFAVNLALQAAPLQAACRVGVERFVQVSTACVYPHDAPIPTKESHADRWDPEPTNRGYGLAKLMGEELVRWAVREHGIHAIVVRPFNAFGPGDNWDPRQAHVIPALIMRALRGQGTAENPLRVYGSGQQSRAFVHAEDVAKGMLLAGERLDPAEVVHIGHSTEIKMTDLAEAICNAVRPEGAHLTFDHTEPNGYQRRSACVDRQRERLGWSPGNRVWEALPGMVKEGKKTLARYTI
jgi:GDP-L-fucose synthase